MALILIGSPRSRAMRNLWMMEELGVDFEHRPVEWNDPWLKSADYLALNPGGSIPLLLDDGFALAESMAINLHLARKYGGGALHPADPQSEALVWRWCLWAQGHVEPWVQRDEAVRALRDLAPRVCKDLLGGALATLDRALAGRDWLVGETFSVADLNVAGVISPSRIADLDLTVWPNVAAWWARCYARPAAASARQRYAA
jgi:glutathione S-transferase